MHYVPVTGLMNLTLWTCLLFKPTSQCYLRLQLPTTASTILRTVKTKQNKTKRKAKMMCQVTCRFWRYTWDLARRYKIKRLLAGKLLIFLCLQTERQHFEPIGILLPNAGIWNKTKYLSRTDLHMQNQVLKADNDDFRLFLYLNILSQLYTLIPWNGSRLMNCALRR